MIVPMKKAYIVVQAHNGRTMLRDLRKGGLLHITSEQVQTQKIEQLQKSHDQIYTLRNVILDLQDKKHMPSQTDASEEVFFMSSLNDIRDFLRQKKNLKRKLRLIQLVLKS